MAEKIKGQDKLERQFESLKKISIPVASLAGAQKLMEISQRNAPVRTGFLRDSHEAVETSEGAEVRVTADYAAFVEFGTLHMAAQPYLRPAIDENKEVVLKDVGENVEKQMKELV